MVNQHYTTSNGSPVVTVRDVTLSMPTQLYAQIISRDVAIKMRKILDIMEGKEVSTKEDSPW
jgi:hypothetical protein